MSWVASRCSIIQPGSLSPICGSNISVADTIQEAPSQPLLRQLALTARIHTERGTLHPPFGIHILCLVLTCIALAISKAADSPVGGLCGSCLWEAYRNWPGQLAASSNSK
jgi:hypothetical protein